MHQISSRSDEIIRRAVRTVCVATPSASCRGQPVADPNRTRGTVFTRVATVLPSEQFGRATGSPLRRFLTRTYASSEFRGKTSILCQEKRGGKTVKKFNSAVENVILENYGRHRSTLG